MAKWEYLTEIVHAHINNPGARKMLGPSSSHVGKEPYAPAALMPLLNERGAAGWELVHMQPIAGEGRKADVYHNGADSTWSNTYFCAFKRPVAD